MIVNVRAPGVRFAPTDAMLVIHYSLPEIIESGFDISCINRYDIYSTNPSNLPFQFVHGARRNEAYFYTPRHPIGQRSTKTNRRTGKVSRTVPAGPNNEGGVWHPNGDTQVLDEKGLVVGHRASFTFKKRTADHGKKGLSGTDWMMYEYRRADEHKDGMADRLCKIYNKYKQAADDMITAAEFEAAASADIPYKANHMSSPINKEASSGDVGCDATQSRGCAGGSPAVVFQPQYTSQTREEKFHNYLEGQGGHKGMISSRDITTGRELLTEGCYRKYLRQQESPSMSFTLGELEALDSEPRGGEGAAAAQSNNPSPSILLPVRESTDGVTVTEQLDMDNFPGIKLSDIPFDQELARNCCMSDVIRCGDDGSSYDMQFGSLPIAASTQLDPAIIAADNIGLPSSDDSKEWENYVDNLLLLLDA